MTGTALAWAITTLVVGVVLGRLTSYLSLRQSAAKLREAEESVAVALGNQQRAEQESEVARGILREYRYDVLPRVFKSNREWQEHYLSLLVGTSAAQDTLIRRIDLLARTLVHNGVKVGEFHEKAEILAARKKHEERYHTMLAVPPVELPPVTKDGSPEGETPSEPSTPDHTTRC